MEKKKNLSEVLLRPTETLAGKTVAVITAEWNPDITFSMRDAAVDFLKQYNPQAILLAEVPGSFELINAASRLLEEADGLIVIGCVIQGETPHFTFISQAVANGIADLNLRSEKPVIFGVLTTNSMEEAKERAGGKHGNKGIEAAAAIVKMLNLKSRRI
jgi:6,7-dimethyl-8-ribityllumazine synthase